MVNRKLFRSTLTEVKEQYPQRPAHGPQPQQQLPPRKKPAPPDQTFAENFYYVKQMQAHTRRRCADGRRGLARDDRVVRPRLHQVDATRQPEPDDLQTHDQIFVQRWR